MLICFEGPSAIGKTTLCTSLQEEFHIIPEANVLFQRSPHETPFQYIDYQLQRYQLARSPAIFDGDIFQPLWYNRAYHDPALSAITTYYTDAIKNGCIRFPDLYILFHTDLDELKKRKASDLTRQRRNFDKHLHLIDAQQEYFTFLKTHTSIQVAFMPYTSVADTRYEVLQLLSTFEVSQRDDIDNINTITNWLLS